MPAEPTPRAALPLPGLLALGALALGSATLATGCATGIQALYEDEKALALSQAGGVPDDWQPDLRIRLGQDAVDEIVQVALDQGLLEWKPTLQVGDFMGTSPALRPRASVKRLSLSPSQACDTCLALDARVKGQAHWTAANLSGKLPFTADVDATVEFTTVRDGDAWQIEARIRDVDKVRLETGSLGRIDATPILGGWVEGALESVPAVPLGAVGGGELPLRAARLETTGGKLELALLSDLPATTPVDTGGASDAAWRLRVHEDTLLALARREAFAAGTIAYDTAATPTALHVTGQGFSMDLRLWRLSGAGWWRDYRVRGKVAVAGRNIDLAPTEAEEGEKSKGAGLADPLALLAEGRILDAVADGLAQAIPAARGFDVGDQHFVARPATVQGARGVVELTGSLETREAKGGTTLGRP